MFNLNLKYSENDICFKYSEDTEALKKVLNETVIIAKMVGVDKFFEDDKDERAIVRVEITRNGRTIDFRFGMSIRDTEVLQEKDRVRMQRSLREVSRIKREVFGGLLYSILSCIRSDYYCPNSFEEFCSELGYNTDSRKALRTFEACREQSFKLQRIFTEKEIESFPS